MSHVAVSFETPEYTGNSDGLGALRILDAVRLLGLEKKQEFIKPLLQNLYGKVQEVPQSETTPFYPTFTLCSSKNVCLLDYRKLS